MQREYFWGAELSKSQTVSKWSPERGGGEDGLDHILELKQAVLGAKTTVGERNIVEVTTNTFEGKSIKQPILSLELGKTDACSTNLTFRAPVTFKLTKGSGPVYLAGTHVLELEDVSAMGSSYLGESAEEEADSSDDDEDDDMEEGGAASPDLKKSKKRAANTPQTGKAKKVAKLDLSKTSTEGDEEESSEEEESDEESSSDLDEETTKKLMKGLANDDVSDSDDSDYDVESGEEEEEESDEDEDESDESDEEVVIPPPKKVKGKPQVNGKPGSAKKAEKGKPAVKTPTSKGDKKDSKVDKKDTPKGTPKFKPKYTTLEEIKSDILKSPAMPKKNAKFENWVRNKYKVEEKEKINELWSWHQKTNLK